MDDISLASTDDFLARLSESRSRKAQASAADQLRLSEIEVSLSDWQRKLQQMEARLMEIEAAKSESHRSTSGQSPELMSDARNAQNHDYSRSASQPQPPLELQSQSASSTQSHHHQQQPSSSSSQAVASTSSTHHYINVGTTSSAQPEKRVFQDPEESPQRAVYSPKFNRSGSTKRMVTVQITDEELSLIMDFRRAKGDSSPLVLTAVPQAQGQGRSQSPTSARNVPSTTSNAVSTNRSGGLLRSTSASRMRSEPRREEMSPLDARVAELRSPAHRPTSPTSSSAGSVDGAWARRPYTEVRHLVHPTQSPVNLDWAVTLCADRHKTVSSPTGKRPFAF